MERIVDNGMEYFGVPAEEVEKANSFVCEACHRFPLRPKECDKGKWDCMEKVGNVVWMTKLAYITLKLEA